MSAIYYPDAFKLSVQAYDQSWKFLRDLRMLAAAAGLKGVIILFDEFENMLTGLKRVDYKTDAFWNRSSVWPSEAISRAERVRNHTRFFSNDRDELGSEQFPVFEMQPLEVSQLQELATRIRDTHALAFGWNPQSEDS